MRHICPSCKCTSQEFSFPLNIGEFSQSSGWKFFFRMDDCLTGWVCPNCWPKIQALALEIHKLIGVSDVKLDAFLGELQ